MIDPDQEMIEFLLLSGAVEVAGFDSVKNEFLYHFTPKMKEVLPELYEEHLNLVNSEVMGLWEKGFVNIDFFADDPVLTITDKAFDERSANLLETHEKWALDEIKRILSK